MIPYKIILCIETLSHCYSLVTYFASVWVYMIGLLVRYRIKCSWYWATNAVVLWTEGWRADGDDGFVGHSRSGGLRPTASALLSTHQRRRRLLLRRQPQQLRQRRDQVVAGSASSLPRRTGRCRRHQDWSTTPRQRATVADDWRRQGTGAATARRRLRRMLVEDWRRCRGRVPDGGTRSAQSRTSVQLQSPTPMRSVVILKQKAQLSEIER